MTKIYIVSAKRTPIGSFNGSLSKIAATQLASIAIKGCLAAINIDSKQIDEVILGNVLSANIGQAPAKQAALLANIPATVPCTTVNKVCASGMKSVMMGAQSIALSDNDLVVVGGFENMSQVPHYLQNQRTGTKLGSVISLDGLLKDRLTDAFSGNHMGLAAELCAEEHNINRKEQDAYAIESYKRSAKAWVASKFKNEIAPVIITDRKGNETIFDTDEEFTNVKFDKIPNLKPVFKKDGTVTAANASTLNDGAATLILASEQKVKEFGLKPIAEIISYADASQKPEYFTTSPAKALPAALAKANIKQSEIDFFEINEAFSVVALANNNLLNLNPDKVNVNGGAVSLGHPLGCSGARIVVTLLNVLQQNKANLGAAAICNGGGGASAIIIKNLV